MVTQTITQAIGRRPRIPTSVLWGGLGVIALLSLFGVWRLQGPYVQLGLVALIALPFLVANGKISLVLFLTITMLLVVKGTHSNTAAGAPEILGGVGYLLITVVTIARIFASGEDFHYDWTEVSALLFLTITSVVGCYYVLIGSSIFSNWYREIIILMPIWLMPILYRKFFSFDDSWEKPLLRLAILFWVFFTLVALLHYRENILSAVYLYETGRSDVSIGSSMFLFFLSVSFLLIKRSWKWNALWSFLLMVSMVGIVISFYRTLWVASIGLIWVILLLGNREERRTGLKFLTITALVALLSCVVLYFIWPTFKFLLLSYSDRFLSTKNVGTDKSLVNRYIEWRFLWQHILGSPVLGYGAGSTFRIFNWLRGFDEIIGYSHNGFLYLILKSGFLGIAFFLSTYLGFFWKGVRLARSKVLGQSHRAFIRALLALQLSVLLYTNTVNAFSDRPLLVYLGISWGFLLVCEEHLKRGERFPDVALIEKGGERGEI